MNLGILIPEFPTQTHIFFWREIEALRNLGANVHVLSTKRPTETCPHSFARTATQQTHYVYPPSTLAAARSFKPIGIVRALKYIGSLSQNIWQKSRALGYLLCAADLVTYARKHELDHIHVHSCSDAAHVAAMARLLGGPPYSLHLHGDLPVYGTDHTQKMAHAAFVSAAARPMQRQLIEQANVPEGRTHTMWMGVDTSQFNPSASKSGRRGPLHLVSIGRLHLCKGHIYAFQALHKLIADGAKVSYTIAGAGPHQRDIEASIAELDLGNHVRMVGSLGEGAVLDLLHSADAFVLSSVGLGEASPVAVMEAMAAGVPVISSIIGGTPDMITDGVDGLLVAQKDVDSLASAIRRLHDHEDFRLRLREAARRRASDHFDSRITARKFLSTVEDSLRQKGNS